MKLFVMSVMIASLATTPVLAQEHYNSDYHRPQVEKHDNRDLAIGLAAILISKSINEHNNSEPRLVYYYGEPVKYSYYSEYNAYQRGFEDRIRREREERVQRAYYCGYYQNC